MPTDAELVAITDEILAANKAELTVDDKLTLKTMEADAYRLQIQAESAGEQAKQAITQINAFIKTLSEKYGYDLKTHALDLTSQKFVERAK